jgi:hypothetical protein
MGVWNSASTVITDVGMQLLADLSGKQKLTLSKVVVGKDYTTPSELTKMTGISHIQMNMNFSEFGEDDNGTAYVDVYLDNSAVTEAFYHQQIGIFAKDLSDKEVLFLVAQADSPDYIPLKDAPVFITHRIFMKYSGNSKVVISVDFSGVVTQDALQAALMNKENVFDKNSAFNKNFSDSADDFYMLGKSAHPGGAETVARSDHVHPVGTILKYAENNWSTGSKTNLLPDTNTWVMSNGKTPGVWGEYAFEATFTGAWEGFSCFFSESALANVLGKTLTLGVDHLTGASSRLEVIVDGSAVNYILQTEKASSIEVAIPTTATSVTIRIIIFSADDLHCEFTGLYLYDKAEDVKANDDGTDIYLCVRKVLQSKLPSYGTAGTMYLTEKGNVYLVKDDGKLLPIAGSETL